MPVNSIDRVTRKERLEQVAEMKLRGMTVRAIGRELHVSHTTIAKDIKLVEQAWMERSADVLGLAKGREVSRLELVIREAWDAWERSKQPEERVLEKSDRPRRSRVKGESNELVITSRSVTRIEQAGSSRFLSVIISASAQIAQILGLNSAAELNITVQRYITSAAAELGMTPSDLQDEINGIMESAWIQQWGPAGPG